MQMDCVSPTAAVPMCAMTVTVLSSRVATPSISHRKLHPDVWTHPTSPQLNRGTHKINQQITPASRVLAVLIQGSHMPSR